MKKRFLLPLLLFFLPATIIGAAYAGFVYSNKVDIKTDTNLGKIDDIKPNFKLDENNYTIYFFPSMQAVDLNFNNDFSEANIRSKIDGANKSQWGYWTNNSYYPKKLETHGGPSISVEQFKTIDEPVTEQKDDNWPTAYTLQFSGWTANKDASKSGYKSQGDYKYLSAFDDLTKIDETSQDGTNPNDKVVFVYPIFTTGKDYKGTKRNQVLLEGEKSRYLSRVDGDENKTYFYYNNLVINQSSQLQIKFAGLAITGWYEGWHYYRDSSSYYLYNSGSATNSIIKEPGIYNVYVYLQRGTSYHSSDANTFNNEINNEKIPLVYEDDTSNEDGFGITKWNWRYTFWMFVKVEKVYEFRLAGTEGRGFTFDTAGQLYVSRFSSAKYTDPKLGKLWKMYYLDNVFMEKGKNNLFTEYTNSNGKPFKIRNTVFSFLPSDENLSTIDGIEAMTDEELNYVNTNEPDLNVKGNYKGISDTSFKKIENSQDEYIKHHENLPNYVPGKDYADYFFASEFKYSGFCKVLIKVDFATSGDHKGKPTSIRVAVVPYLTNVHKVYVYPDETNLVTFRDPETNLIDPENNTTLKAIELTSFEMKANDDYILNDQEITLKDGSKMMLSAYLTQYDVVDHLTNKKIEIGKSYKRHMACWQRVKTS